MPPTITVTISPTGESRIETHGFTGVRCQDATRALEAALGVRESEQLTSAYFAQSQEASMVEQSDSPT